MSKNKMDKKHGFRFISSTITIVFAVLAMLTYIVGASFFGYYSDLNLMILVLTIAGVILCMVSAIFTDKQGNKAIFSCMTILVSILFAVSLMILMNARVYSFAVLLLSDLERDNVEGYYALYCSIAAMGLYVMGIISNFVTGFARGYVRKTEA